MPKSHLRLLLAVCLHLCLYVGLASGQTRSLPLQIVLEAPTPSCTLSGSSNLSFGTHTLEGSGSESVTVSHTRGGGGRVTLEAANITSYTVTVTFPSSFPTLDVDLSLGWSQSLNGTTWTSMGSSRTYTGSASGIWSEVLHSFAIGGTASWDWGDVTAGGSDAATIDVSATCI